MAPCSLSDPEKSQLVDFAQPLPHTAHCQRGLRVPLRHFIPLQKFSLSLLHAEPRKHCKTSWCHGRGHRHGGCVPAAPSPASPKLCPPCRAPGAPEGCFGGDLVPISHPDVQQGQGVLLSGLCASVSPEFGGIAALGIPGARCSPQL